MLSVLERMTPDERRESLESELFVDIGMGFLDQLWLLELEKEPALCDWDSVLRTLRDARRIGGLEGSGLLAVLAIRAEATALGQAGRFDEAFAVLEDALGKAVTPEERLLLHYTATCLSGDREDDAGKLEAARRALAEPAETLPVYRGLTRRLAIPAAARLGDVPAVHRLLLEGVAEERADFPDRSQRELWGELSWLWWTEGQPRRAVGALAALVLTREPHPELPDDDVRTQEFQRKAVYGARKLEDALASSGEKSPLYPCGFFITRGALVTDTKGPCPPSAAQYAVGSAAVRAGLPSLAWALLQRARAGLADDSGDPALGSTLLFLVDHLLVVTAARLGRYEQALGYALACVSDKAVALARDRDTEQPGKTPPPRDDGPEEVARLLVSYAIGPAIVRTLAETPTSGAVLRTLDRLQAGVDTRDGTPAVVLVGEVLADLRRAFSPFAVVGILARGIQESSPDSGVRPLLALALSLAPGASSADAAGCQALAVVELGRVARADTGILANVARFVAEYWARRDGTIWAGAPEAVGGDSLAKAAALLLVRRVEASRIQLPAGVLENLRSLSRDP